MRAHGGLVVTADAGPELLEEADIIVVPGWRGIDSPDPDGLCKRLRAAHCPGRAPRVALLRRVCACRNGPAG